MNQNDRRSSALRAAKLRLLELKMRDYEETPEGRRASEASFRDFRAFAVRRWGSLAAAPAEVRSAIAGHELGALERAGGGVFPPAA